MIFDDFEDTARDLFGFDAGESRDFANTLESAGLYPEEADADDRLFWEIASEYIDEFIDVEEYDLDPYFPDDDYLEAGEEWEMTAESIEGYGDNE